MITAAEIAITIKDLPSYNDFILLESICGADLKYFIEESFYLYIDQKGIIDIKKFIDFLVDKFAELATTIKSDFVSVTSENRKNEIDKSMEQNYMSVFSQDNYTLNTTLADLIVENINNKYYIHHKMKYLIYTILADSRLFIVNARNVMDTISFMDSALFINCESTKLFSLEERLGIVNLIGGDLFVNLNIIDVKGESYGGK